MLVAQENKEIAFASEPNGHILTWGQSGQGKTYFLCRQIEKYVEEGKKVLIIDFSGSYTEAELIRQNFKYRQKIKNINFVDNSYAWQVYCKSAINFQNDLTDAFLEVLGDRSYYQRMILGEVIKETQARDGKINIPMLVKSLERKVSLKREERNDGKFAENVENLLNRLLPYQAIRFLDLEQGKGVAEAAVTVLQLSDFPEKLRRFLTRLFISLYWREIYHQKCKTRYDVLVLDEFQFLPIDDGSTLSSMLREGRKKGLELILGSQFLSHYDRDEVQALQQAGHYVIFRPTPNEYRFSAKIVSQERTKEWIKILKNLQKGEAVLCGKYTLNEGSRVIETPIVVHVK